MKTRARWSGPLPSVGDYLRTARSLYLILAVGAPRPIFVGDFRVQGANRVTLTIDRVGSKVQPDAVEHPFRWDPRGKRRRA